MEKTVNDLKKELDILYRVTSTVHSLELDEVLAEIVRIATEVTGGDSCLVYVLDTKSETLILRASKNRHDKLLQKITMKMGEGITGWVARESKPVAIMEGAHKDPRFKYFRNLPEDSYEAFLSVPIVTKKSVVGVINIQHRKTHNYSQKEINLLSAIGKLVGGAVENALLIEETLELKDALELRKTIDKAKGILMTRRGLSEVDAFRFLQTESMNRRTSLKEVCEAILLADKLLPLDK